MKQELIDFFRIQRRIFGVCPRSGNIFRLSDCKVYLRNRPKKDWKDKLDSISARIDEAEGELLLQEEEIREAARKKGRRNTARMVKALDPVFTPRKLNPDDAKVLFHPIDYVVFDGMKAGALKQLVLLDRRVETADRWRLQRSIEDVVAKGQYDWITLRVDNDGQVREET